LGVETIFGSRANKNQFNDYRFGVDQPVSEDGGMVNYNWDVYRLPLSRMHSIADASTHLKATCRFQVDGLVYTDYARANLEGHDLFGFWREQCRTYEYLIKWLVHTHSQSCIYTLAQSHQYIFFDKLAITNKWLSSSKRTQWSKYRLNEFKNQHPWKHRQTWPLLVVMPDNILEERF